MDQLPLFDSTLSKLVSIRDASVWASNYLRRKVTPSNISYLLQYGRIRKHGNNGNTLVDLDELKAYYDSFDKEMQWKNKLGQDLNWRLSFVEYKESERTKHVHRLHPYKGKFIPQLVEYFLDDHVDEFKRQAYFRKGDIVLDPFCGSGTTLVQANELGMHAIGIDISAFNALIANAKVQRHDLAKLREAAKRITLSLKEFQGSRNVAVFDNHLTSELAKFNDEYFPSPEYKRKVSKGEIDEAIYAKEKERLFLELYHGLVAQYKIKIKQDRSSGFLDQWFLYPVREEIDFVFGELKKIDDQDVRKMLAIILSRTVRSCRATTHADLATLKEPVTTTYYCKKHGKICKPLFSILSWWERYAQDTIDRLRQFDRLRTPTHQICLTGDSRTIDLDEEISKRSADLADLLAKQKIKGIFSSPPYVGLIDYHEQHAYAYEIFGFERKDNLEIGRLSKGQGREARENYVNDIAQVLRNVKKYLCEDYDVFLVANDKFNLYQDIAQKAGMVIVNQFKRPVLNRVEKDRSNAYSETIFHFREKGNAAE